MVDTPERVKGIRGRQDSLESRRSISSVKSAQEEGDYDEWDKTFHRCEPFTRLGGLEENVSDQRYVG